MLKTLAGVVMAMAMCACGPDGQLIDADGVGNADNDTNSVARADPGLQAGGDPQQTVEVQDPNPLDPCTKAECQDGYVQDGQGDPDASDRDPRSFSLVRVVPSFQAVP